MAPLVGAYSAWFAAGFRDLISVVPPGAPLSERTKLRPEDRGKVPGLHGHHGWYGFDWMKHETTAKDVATWERHKANLGLRATRFPAVDIDVTDLEIRDFIQGLADRHLGPAPARTGRAPKLLLVYRLAEGQSPMVRRRLRFKGPDGRDHLVELLGHGQQYVVEGIHPVTRRPYTWDTHPAERGADALTPITHAQLDTFAQDMEDLLDCIGCTDLHWEGSGDEVKDREAIVQGELKAPSLDALTDAVSRIPNDNTQFPSRTDYLRMGCAIKAAGADDPDRAMEVWEEWAARWEGNETIAGNDPIEVVSDWERMKPPFEVGWGYIRDVAQEHGFPVAAEEFGELSDDDLAGMLPKSKPPRHIKTYRFGDIFVDDTPEDPDLIGPGLLGPGELLLIAGPPKSMKSLLLQDLLVSAALGRHILGFDIQRPLRVFWLQAEMTYKLLRKRAKAEDFSPEELVQLNENMVVSDRFDVLLDAEGEAYVAKLILDAFDGKAPDIIAFDPLANLFDGENENDNAQMMRFLRERLEGVRRRLSEKTAIVLVHHSNKASREYIETDPFSAIRGAGALRGYYTSAIVIYQPERDAPERHVFFDFRSDAAPEPVTVRYQSGRMLSVLDPLAEFEDTPVKAPEAVKAHTTVEEKFLAAMEDLLAANLTPSPNSTARDDYAPKMLKKHHKCKGLRFEDLKSAMTRLLNTGKLQVGEAKGSQGRKRQVLLVTNNYNKGNTS